MITAVVNLDDADIPQMARVAFESGNASPFHSQKWSVEEYEEHLKKIIRDEHFLVVAAKRKDTRELVGWMGLYIGFSEMMFIEPWKPYILSSENKEEITTALASEAISLSEKIKVRRLEVMFTGITDDNRESFQDYIRWYESEGLAFVCEEISMRANIDASSLPNLEIPTEIQLVSLNDVTNKQIMDPFFSAFLDSKDLLFLSMCRENQMISFNHWFDRKRVTNPEATRIAIKNGKVVGFCIVHPGDNELSMGPVGVIPEERGKGLGKAMVIYALQSLYNQGLREITLDVCTENIAALTLYEKLGFTKSRSNIFHALKLP